MMTKVKIADLVNVLGERIGSENAKNIFDALATTSNRKTTKTFGTVTYESVQEAGLSLQFERDQCQAVDLYNQGAAKDWKAFSCLPLHINFTNKKRDDNIHSFSLDHASCGRSLVEAFGEPDRKGGGEPLRGGGASGLGPGAWMEWQSLQIADKDVYLMIELSGPDARGAQRWQREKGGEARWGICTLSLPS